MLNCELLNVALKTFQMLIQTFMKGKIHCNKTTSPLITLALYTSLPLKQPPLSLTPPSLNTPSLFLFNTPKTKLASKRQQYPQGLFYGGAS